MRYITILTAAAVLILASLHLLNDDASVFEHRLASLDKAYKLQSAELTAVKNELNFLRQRTKELQDNSLQGIAEKANNGLFKGLGNLFDSVGRELKRAQDQIEKNIEQGKQPNSAENDSPKSGKRT